MINIRERKIAICTPVYRYTTPDFTTSLLKTNRALSGVPLLWLNIVGEPDVAHARNILVSEAIRRGATDVIFIDADIGWEPAALLRLYDVPGECLIVAGASQQHRHAQVSFGSSLDPEKTRQLGGLFSGYAASAFMRIDTSVFGMLKYPVEYQSPQGACKSWFFHEINTRANGLRLQGLVTPDYYFSKKCKEEGVEVWIDPAVQLRRHASIALTAVMADSFKPSQG